MELVLAVPPATNEAFLREVDEELRREQVVNFWRDYGRWIAIALGVGLLALAGTLYWRHYQSERAANETERFNQVYDTLASGKIDDARKPLAELAKSDLPTYAALAKTVEADVVLREMDANDPAKSATKLKEAAAKFAAIANDPKTPQPLRDLSLIRQTYAEFDQLTPDQIIARLKPLAVKDGPWLPSAGELVAIAELQRGKPDQARAMLQMIIADPNVPTSVRTRVVQLSSAIENQATPPAAPTAQETKKQ